MLHPALTPDFYDQLAWQLSAAFRSAADVRRRHYWCDGILDPEWAEDYHLEHVRRSRQLRLRAWVDEGRRQGGDRGQTIWPLTVQLGPWAYAAYLRGGGLTALWPAPEDDAWAFDFSQHQIAVQFQ